MAYLISDEAKDLLKDLKKFCDNEVREQAKEFDKSGEWPKDMYAKAIEQGYQALEVPQEFGGPGLSRVDIAALMEEMAKADAGFATTISASGLGMKPVLIAGNDAQKKKLCETISNGGFAAFCLTEPGAGSDPGAGKTTAVKEGDSYVLNGRKCFITNGEVADVYCVTALTDKEAGMKGMSMFFVEKGTPGLSTGNHEDKMGIRGTRTSDLIFENVKVPKENLLGGLGKGFKVMMNTLSSGRIGVAAQAVGVAQSALDEAIKYTQERVQFGKTLSKFQNTQFTIADMATKVEAARLLVYQAAQQKDNGQDPSLTSSMAKYYAAEVANEVAYKSLQLHGGYGFVKDYRIERIFRDARILPIYEGTSQVQQIVIAGNILK